MIVVFQLHLKPCRLRVAGRQVAVVVQRQPQYVRRHVLVRVREVAVVIPVNVHPPFRLCHCVLAPYLQNCVLSPTEHPLDPDPPPGVLCNQPLDLLRQGPHAPFVPDHAFPRARRRPDIHPAACAGCGSRTTPRNASAVLIATRGYGEPSALQQRRQGPTQTGPELLCVSRIGAISQLKTPRNRASRRCSSSRRPPCRLPSAPLHPPASLEARPNSSPRQP